MCRIKKIIYLTSTFMAIVTLASINCFAVEPLAIESLTIKPSASAQYDRLIKLRHLNTPVNLAIVKQMEITVTAPENNYLRAPVYAYIAKLYASSANWTDADKYVDRAIEFLGNTQDNELVIDALESVSWVFFSRGDYADAIYYVQEMADLAYKTNNDRGKAIALNRLGLSYLELELHSLAIAPLEAALALARESNNTDSEFLALLYIINVRMELTESDPTKTMALIHDAERVVSKFNIDDGYIDRLKGVVNQKLGNDVLAKRWLNNAHKKASDANDVRLLSIVTGNLAEFYRNIKQPRLALEHAKASLKYFEQLNNGNSIAGVNYQLSELYNELGDDGSSLIHLKQYAAYHQSASDNNTVSLLTVMDKRIDAIKRKQRLVALQNNVLSNQLLVQSSKNKQYVFIFVIILLAVTLIFISALFFIWHRMLKVQVDQSMRDALTGAYNRNYVKKSISKIKKHFNYNVKKDVSLGAILIDCDDFKLINDQYGHAGGDEALKGVVTAIFSQIRESDLLFRWGGDEFVLLCESVTQQQLADLAQRITNSVRDLRIDYNDIKITITISVGYSLHSEEEFNLTKLINQADEFLYQSKSSGKDHFIGEPIGNELA